MLKELPGFGEPLGISLAHETRASLGFLDDIRGYLKSLRLAAGIPQEVGQPHGRFQSRITIRECPVFVFGLSGTTCLVQCARVDKMRLRVFVVRPATLKLVQCREDLVGPSERELGSRLPGEE